ncbi:hypothetical protein D0Z07_5962 [Hyphodiscus hymeniophilus]|uniref:Uncharacterized protein n=1 Tax=Hyphodiscus hymeniophilus TaxID=353542 RepID=A0A9P6VHR5_9HELO|nr:hypothetical protein D0Z07_5962 [Hyphodiscus hymeniophilus]
MANQEPRLEGFGQEDHEKAEAGGPNFQPSTINHFIEAAMSGVMPGGLKTEQPLFPKEYIRHFSTKYVDWAPPPFDKLPPPQMEAMGPIPGGPMPGDSPPPIIRIMHVISGMDRMFSRAFNRDLPMTEPSFKAVRSRLWFGMPPISDARWAAKSLDAEENVEEALAIIQQTVNVFKHQLKPDVQGEMRATHNKVWVEFDVFQDAIVAVRSQNGEPAPEFNIAKLWQEYIKAWAFKRLKILFQLWKDRMIRVMQSGRQINATQSTIRIDHWAIMVLNKLLDLYVDSEIFLRVNTAGFSMLNGIDSRLIGAITLEKSEAQLNAIYATIENKRVADLRRVLSAVLAARTRERRRQAGASPDFLEKPGLLSDREFAMKSLMGQMENPLPLVMESWVQNLADQSTEKCGFVIYRNTYVQSNTAWMAFVKKLDTALDSGWEGVVDPENVKRKTRLHWVSGKEEGIPQGDINAVRQHFKTFSESVMFPANITKTICLAITPDSYKSFAKADQDGDYRGFLVAIDPDYDASKAEERKYKPGFTGSFNIIDQLVWTDLFALGVNRAAQNAQEYWGLAVQHPWGVYVGPTTGILRKKWRIMDDGVKALAESLRQI